MSSFDTYELYKLKKILKNTVQYTLPFGTQHMHDLPIISRYYDVTSYIIYIFQQPGYQQPENAILPLFWEILLIISKLGKTIFASYCPFTDSKKNVKNRKDSHMRFRTSFAFFPLDPFLRI